MRMPENSLQKDPILINLRHDVRFRDCDWQDAPGPAFLDKSLTVRTCLAKIFSSDDLVDFIKNADDLFILDCKYLEDTDQYVLRHVVGSSDLDLAPVVSDIEIQEINIDTIFNPCWTVLLKVHADHIQDLEAAWGRKELELQIGQHILRGIDDASNNEG